MSSYQIDARVYTDYRVAKREAAMLAIAQKFVLLQHSDRQPRIALTTGGIRKFPTWLAAWSWLYECWRDRQPKIPMAIPMAILLD
jgi:hypothetical protein